MERIDYIVHDQIGRILSYGHTVSDVWRMQLGHPDLLLESGLIDLSPYTVDGLTIRQGTGEGSSTYFDGAAVALRPLFPGALDKQAIVADGSDAATISAIPNPSDLVVNGRTVTVIDGSLVLTADTGATYEVSCKQWPYLDWSVTITATPPGA